MPSRDALEAGPRRRGRARRGAGGAALPALLALLVVAGALGFNYQRNYEIDKAREKNARFGSYSTEALAIMAEGYRQELADVQAAQGPTRVALRDGHHLDERVQDFERVQRATRRIRENAVELAQIKAELDDLEAEQERRAHAPTGAMVHVERLFRI